MKPLLDTLRSGRIPVPDSLMDAAFRSREWEGLLYKSCRSRETGTEIVFEKSALGVPVEVAVELRVEDFVFTSERQSVVVRLVDQRVGSDGWVGKLVAQFVATFIAGILDGQAPPDASRAVSIARRDDGTFEVGLGGLQPVKDFLTLRVPLLNTPVVSMLPRLKVVHVNGGLEITRHAG